MPNNKNFWNLNRFSKQRKTSLEEALNKLEQEEQQRKEQELKEAAEKLSLLDAYASHNQQPFSALLGKLDSTSVSEQATITSSAGSTTTNTPFVQHGYWLQNSGGGNPVQIVPGNPGSAGLPGNTTVGPGTGWINTPIPSPSIQSMFGLNRIYDYLDTLSVIAVLSFEKGKHLMAQEGDVIFCLDTGKYYVCTQGAAYHPSLLNGIPTPASASMPAQWKEVALIHLTDKIGIVHIDELQIAQPETTKRTEEERRELVDEFEKNLNPVLSKPVEKPKDDSKSLLSKAKDFFQSPLEPDGYAYQ